MNRLIPVLALAAALAACSSDPAVSGSAGTAMNPAQVEASAPPMDPTRKVSEQDCGRAVDLSAGNLMCK